MALNEAVIVSACRTPVGSFRGTLSSIPAPRLGAIVIKEAVRRAGIKGEDVEAIALDTTGSSIRFMTLLARNRP